MSIHTTYDLCNASYYKSNSLKFEIFLSTISEHKLKRAIKMDEVTVTFTLAEVMHNVIAEYKYESWSKETMLKLSAELRKWANLIDAVQLTHPGYTE